MMAYSAIALIHIPYMEFILLHIQLRFTHLRLFKSKDQMDEHYDVNDAGAWMNIMDKH